MTVMTENNGWAIVWMNDKYYLRHLACGSYIRNHAVWGCLCKGLLPDKNGTSKVPVDDLILKKFKLITKGDVKI